MMFTFLPAFARGAGMSVEEMSRVLAARDLMSLAAPLGARASDRRGTVNVMALTALLVTGGIIATTLGGVGFVIAMLVTGVGITGYQVAMQAWVGDEVAYERRGRATGLVELAWGGAALLGLPAVGLLIDAFGWRAPFFALSLISLPVVLRIRSLRDAVPGNASSRSPRPNWSGPVIAAIVVNSALAGAAQFMFLSHGLWLEDTFGLDTAQIGMAIVAVGAVEVTATLGSARLTDVLGKRRSIIAGATLMTLGLAAMALFPSPTLATGLTLLALSFLGFEFAIVSSIPLIAELDPAARAQMIAISMTAATVTRAVVTLIAASIYVASGYSAVMTVAAIIGTASVILATTTMVEPRGEALDA